MENRQKTEDCLLNELIEIRRKIHKMAETGLKEYNTSAYVRQYLKSIPNIELQDPIEGIETAVIARINVLNAKETFLFRCELDALDWKEESGEDFAAETGKHHACGHDAHTAIMMVTCKNLAARVGQLRRSVIFCFQPGEEGKAGASKLLSGYPSLLDNVSHCFALHSGNHRRPGTVLASTGNVLANSNRFVITIKGTGCHPMIPEHAVDANFIGCSLVTHLYALKQRVVSPLEQGTMSIVKVEGGKSLAMISDQFQITGTLRIGSLQAQNKMKREIEKLSKSFCASFNAEASFEFKKSNYRSVNNDKAATQIVQRALSNVVSKEQIQEQKLSFAGEDFCEFSERVPSCYFILGSAVEGSFNQNGESIYPLHSSVHRLDQSFMPYGVRIWMEIALGK